MISPITKLKLVSLAAKYGVTVEKFTPGEVTVHVETLHQFKGQINYLISDFRDDPHVYSISVDESENLVHIIYDHDALEETETINRWLNILDEYT